MNKSLSAVCVQYYNTYSCIYTWNDSNGSSNNGNNNNYYQNNSNRTHFFRSTLHSCIILLIMIVVMMKMAQHLHIYPLIAQSHHSYKCMLCMLNSKIYHIYSRTCKGVLFTYFSFLFFSYWSWSYVINVCTLSFEYIVFQQNKIYFVINKIYDYCFYQNKNKKTISNMRENEVNYIDEDKYNNMYNRNKYLFRMKYI